MGEPWTAVYLFSERHRSLKRRVSDQQSKQRERPMQDMLAQLEKLRSDAAECAANPRLGDRSKEARTVRPAGGTLDGAGVRGRTGDAREREKAIA